MKISPISTSTTIFKGSMFPGKSTDAQDTMLNSAVLGQLTKDNPLFAEAVKARFLTSPKGVQDYNEVAKALGVKYEALYSKPMEFEAEDAEAVVSKAVSQLVIHMKPQGELAGESYAELISNYAELNNAVVEASEK